MAKGDHSRSENKSDEQQQLAQSYLAQTQGMLGNQYGNLYNNYMGQNSPTFGSINNMGSTTPNYSLYQNPFQGNTGQSSPNNPFGGGLLGGQQNAPPMGNQNFDPYGEFQQAVQSLGIQPGQFRGNTQNMDAVTNYLNQKFPGQQWTNGGTRAGDWMGYGGQGAGLDVLPAGDANWQNLFDPANGYSGGSSSGFGLGGGSLGGVAGTNMQDYGKISSLFGSMLPQYQGLYNDLRGQYGGFLGSAGNMAQTGGLSDQDKADMRSRAMSPIRGQYDMALQNLNRQKALQGGYSPGYTTALGRFNRQAGQGVSDAVTNADAGIAQLVQQGKLGGLSAWGSGLSGMGSGLLGALGGQNQAIGGMAGLYGTTPAWTNTLGNQMLTASGQNLEGAGLQNNLSLGLIQGQNQIGSSVPGNMASTLNPIGQFVGNVGTGIGGATYPWMH